MGSLQSSEGVWIEVFWWEVGGALSDWGRGCREVGKSYEGCVGEKGEWGEETKGW